MKKAKILIPAVAVLALSSAAAVTGTVAWFTSSTKANVHSNGLTVVNTSSGDLKIEVTADALYGTSGTGPITHSTLTDGSVNIADGTVWKFDEAKGGTNYIQVNDQPANKTSVSDVVGTYRATKFTIKFTYTFYKGSGAKNAALYFDAKNTLASTTDTVEANMKKALRVGFQNTTATGQQKNNIVYAPYETEALTYAQNATTKGTYAAKNVADKAKSEFAYAATVGENKNYIGLFTNSDTAAASATDTITVDVFTWIEGTDETNVKNGVDLFAGKFAMDLKFVAKDDVSK